MRLIGKIYEVFIKYIALIPAFIGFISGTILSVINRSFGILIFMVSGLIAYLFLLESVFLIGKCGFEEIWKQFGVQAKADFTRPWKLTKIVLLTSCCTAVVISILKIIETKSFFYLFGIPISGLLFYLVMIVDKLIKNQDLSKRANQGMKKQTWLALSVF